MTKCQFDPAQKSRFDQIHFLDDFLRSEENHLVHHTPNLRAIAALFGAMADRAGIPTSRSLPLSAGGELDVAMHMRSLGLPLSPSGWANACDADLTPWERFSPLVDITGSTLVIGWCLPPSLMRFLDRRGVVFIDFEIAPIRFCRHLKLWSRTNDGQVLKVLNDWAEESEGPWLEAAIMRSAAARQGASAFGDSGASVGIFAGQTEVDLALVADGQIRNVHEVIDDVTALARTVDVLAIKPHPYARDLTALRQLAATCGSDSQRHLDETESLFAVLRRERQIRVWSIVGRVGRGFVFWKGCARIHHTGQVFAKETSCSMFSVVDGVARCCFF